MTTADSHAASERQHAVPATRSWLRWLRHSVEVGVLALAVVALVNRGTLACHRRLSPGRSGFFDQYGTGI